MTVEVELTLKDFIEASLTAGKRARYLRIICLCVFGGMTMMWGYELNKFLGGYFLGVGAFMLMMGLVAPFSIRRNLKQMWVKHHIYGQSQRYTFDEEGFHAESYSGRSMMRWHGFSHWTESKSMFQLYFGPQINYFLPKRCLSSKEQIMELRDFLKAAIGRTKYAAPVRAFSVTAPDSTADATPAPPR